MSKDMDRLSEYNGIFKEADEVYHNIAKTLGLSDCAFWILYCLRTEGGALTQSEICNTFYQPKQTVNSALKKLELDGCIELSERADRRSKQILLTQKGITLAEESVDRVIGAERTAMSRLDEAEQEAFIRLFRKYTDLLKYNMEELRRKLAEER